MKIKDLLQFDPESEILITLQRDTGGSTTFDVSKCRTIQFQDVGIKKIEGKTCTELRCSVHKPVPENKKEPKYQWEDCTSSSSWGNYNAL